MLLESRFDDFWNVDGGWEVLGPWTGFTEFTPLNEKLTNGIDIQKIKQHPGPIIYGQSRTDTRKKLTIARLQSRDLRETWFVPALSSSRSSSDPNPVTTGRPDGRCESSDVFGMEKADVLALSIDDVRISLERRKEGNERFDMERPDAPNRRQEILHSTMFRIRERLSDSTKKLSGTSVKKLWFLKKRAARFLGQRGDLWNIYEFLHVGCRTPASGSESNPACSPEYGC